jgi:hypothetical protein
MGFVLRSPTLLRNPVITHGIDIIPARSVSRFDDYVNDAKHEHAGGGQNEPFHTSILANLICPRQLPFTDSEELCSRLSGSSQTQV